MFRGISGGMPIIGGWRSPNGSNGLGNLNMLTQRPCAEYLYKVSSSSTKNTLLVNLLITGELLNSHTSVHRLVALIAMSLIFVIIERQIFPSEWTQEIKVAIF